MRYDEGARAACLRSGTIKQAIETAVLGTTVQADSASKLVSVQGHADFATIRSIVIGAGYTPSAEKTK